MAVESAWGKYPDYEINLVRARFVARAWYGDLLLAESNHAIRLEETRHVDRLYFPVADVRWEHFTPTDEATICGFKGQASYWSLTAVDPVEPNILWAYATPFEEVAGIVGHVAFYQDRVRIELEDQWPEDDPTTVTTRFPAWGDAVDLLASCSTSSPTVRGSSSRRRTATPPATSSRVGTCWRRGSSRRRRRSRTNG